MLISPERLSLSDMCTPGSDMMSVLTCMSLLFEYVLPKVLLPTKCQKLVLTRQTFQHVIAEHLTLVSRILHATIH